MERKPKNKGGRPRKKNHLESEITVKMDWVTGDITVKNDPDLFYVQIIGMLETAKAHYIHMMYEEEE